MDINILKERLEALPTLIARLEEEAVEFFLEHERVKGEFKIYEAKEFLKEQAMDSRVSATAIKMRIVERCEPERMKEVLANAKAMRKKAEIKKRDDQLKNLKIIGRIIMQEMQSIGGV